MRVSCRLFSMTRTARGSRKPNPPNSLICANPLAVWLQQRCRRKSPEKKIAFRQETGRVGATQIGRRFRGVADFWCYQ